MEVQTLIDECVDGTWDATLLVGSNVIGHWNRSTFLGAALKLHLEIIKEKERAR